MELEWIGNHWINLNWIGNHWIGFDLIGNILGPIENIGLEMILLLCKTPPGKLGVPFHLCLDLELLKNLGT